MEQAGLNPLDGEVENTYRLLTNDDVGQGVRTQARNPLQKQGIDVEQLQSDFVSYGTVRRHLKRCLGVERNSNDTDDDPAEAGTQRIAALQYRTVEIIEIILSQLHIVGEPATGDIDVSCSECGMHATVREFIENDGCHCEKSTSE